MNGSGDPIERLVAELKRLPTIGHKTALRLAHHLLDHKEQSQGLLLALETVTREIHACSICGNYTADDPCRICSDSRRDVGLLCVVQGVPDLQAIEASSEFMGRYHILGGLVSPLKGIGPEHLNVEPLLARIVEEEVREVIIATSPTVDGEATALYLRRLLEPSGVKLTRPSSGMPIGTDIEYLDRVTIGRAIKGRGKL